MKFYQVTGRSPSQETNVTLNFQADDAWHAVEQFHDALEDAHIDDMQAHHKAQDDTGQSFIIDGIQCSATQIIQVDLDNEPGVRPECSGRDTKAAVQGVGSDKTGSRSFQVDFIKAFNNADQVVIDGYEIDEFRGIDDDWRLGCGDDPEWTFTPQEVTINSEGDGVAIDDEGNKCQFSLRTLVPFRKEHMGAQPEPEAVAA